MSALIGGMILIAIFILPVFIAGGIAKNKNRSVNKAQFLALFFGWLAVAGLWLCLKNRDPVTGILR